MRGGLSNKNKDSVKDYRREKEKRFFQRVEHRRTVFFNTFGLPLPTLTSGTWWIMKEDNWRVVHIASGMTNANIIVGRLETEGIPTRLKYEAAGTIYAVTIDGLGEVRVMVPSNYLEKARKVLSVSYTDEDINWEEK